MKKEGRYTSLKLAKQLESGLKELMLTSKQDIGEIFVLE